MHTETPFERFFITGGTLPVDAGSYVERQADRDLYDSLFRGQYCYVLNSRQMGKSSLMVRTALRLKAQGVRVVVLDLTAIGQNLTAEQWYSGLLDSLGEQLDLEVELEQHWLDSPNLGPLQRFMSVLDEVVLGRIVETDTNLVVFIDEIDYVRSLSFPADEFFAAIRECYNRRTTAPRFDRLIFCLIGVATPADLIRDTRTTPFNIGRRIELRDFTDLEAEALSTGLREQSPLLKRVSYWTGGHPYLSQRLCRAIAQDKSATSPSDVDRICRDLFLNEQAMERDDNLLFVRDRMLRGGAPLIRVLEVYRRIWQGRRIPANETNPIVSVLKMAGIVKEDGGILRIRNPIYRCAFNERWIRENTPIEEARRQLIANRRAALRIGSIAVPIVALIIWLFLSERVQRRKADERLYAAEMTLAQHAQNQGNALRALELLESSRPGLGGPDFRGFEWRYLWSLFHQHLMELRGPRGAVGAIAFSPSGRNLAVSGENGQVALWSTTSWKNWRTLGRPGRTEERDLWHGYLFPVQSLAYSDDGMRLARMSHSDTTVWELKDEEQHSTHELCGTGGAHEFDCKVALAGGRFIGLHRGTNAVRVEDAGTRALLFSAKSGHHSYHYPLAISRDGKYLAAHGSSNADPLKDIVSVWSIPLRRIVLKVESNAEASAAAFSPDGLQLAVGTWDGSLMVWDVRTGRKRQAPNVHIGFVRTVAFSPSGNLIVTGGQDGTARVWDLGSLAQTANLTGHRATVTAIAFSSDGRQLASASEDGTVRIWNPERLPGVGGSQIIHAHGTQITSGAFSPDSQFIATGALNGSIKAWRLKDIQQTAEVRKSHPKSTWRLSFAPDSVHFASWNVGGAQIWSLKSRKQVIERKADVFIGYQPDGDCLVGVRPRNKPESSFTLIDLLSGKEHGNLPAENWFADSISWTGNWIIFPHGEGHHTIFDINEHKVKGRIATKEGGTSRSAFSPDGRYLALGGHTGSIALWNLSPLRQIGELRGHGGAVGSLSFSPDGRTLASASEDGTVKLWSMIILREVFSTSAHTGPVRFVAFSHDNKVLASGGTDGKLLLWRASSWAEIESRE